MHSGAGHSRQGARGSGFHQNAGSIILFMSGSLLQLIERVWLKGSPAQAIAQAEQAYCSIKAHKLSQITTQEAVKLYETINSKFYKPGAHAHAHNWHENELRLFIWVLCCFLFVQSRAIEVLEAADFEYFTQIFHQKDAQLFEYQSRALCNSTNKLWEKDEEELLKSIIKNKNGKVKWNEVSKEMFQVSAKKYFRTSKQCREKWNNHLDPSKLKGCWRAEQCLKMFEFVKEHGKKWASLVRVLDYSRNEHAIKNKFNSIMRKYTRLQDIYREEGRIYSQIIKRISKNIKNKSLQMGYDFNESYSSESAQKVRVQKGHATPQCHPYALLFMKKLEKYDNNEADGAKECQEIHKIRTQQSYENNQAHVIEGASLYGAKSSYQPSFFNYTEIGLNPLAPQTNQGQMFGAATQKSWGFPSLASLGYDQPSFLKIPSQSTQRTLIQKFYPFYSSKDCP